MLRQVRNLRRHHRVCAFDVNVRQERGQGAPEGDEQGRTDASTSRSQSAFPDLVQPTSAAGAPDGRTRWFLEMTTLTVFGRFRILGGEGVLLAGLTALLAASPAHAFSSSREAEQAAKEASREVERTTKCMASAAERNEKILERGRKALAATRDLLDEKKKSLKELSQGFYCSQCGRTSSEIEKGGEGFKRHLGRVSGRPIPAPATKIKEKAQSYDKQIEASRARFDDAVVENQRLIEEHRVCRTKRTEARNEEARALALAAFLKAQEEQVKAQEAARKLAEAKRAEQKERAALYRQLFEKLLARSQAQFEQQLVTRGLPPNDLVLERIKARRRAEQARSAAMRAEADFAEGRRQTMDEMRQQLEKDWALFSATYRASGGSSQLRERLTNPSEGGPVAAPSWEVTSRVSQKVKKLFDAPTVQLPSVQNFGESLKSKWKTPDVVQKARALAAKTGDLFKAWEDPARGTMGTGSHNDLHGRAHNSLILSGGPVGDLFKTRATDERIWLERVLDDTFETFGNAQEGEP